MEYKKLTDGSYVHNCLLMRRESDSGAYLFHQDGDKSITAYLNGYAIIPLEEYYKMKGEEFDNSEILEADKQLRNN